MTKEICESSRIVFYWLTRDERDNNSELKNEYRNWANKGYKVCTFVSGNENLVESTKELLVHNREVIAKKEQELVCDNFSSTADM